MSVHVTDGASKVGTKLNAWQRNAERLADWAWDRLVIRDDVWGGYNSPADREKLIFRADGTSYKLGSTCTRPTRKQRGKVKFTRDVLVRHFFARRTRDIAGAHTTSIDNRSRYGTAEIDVHGEGGNDPQATLAAALAWYDRLKSMGFSPLLWDSNGAGGYHLDVLFAEPIETPRLFWFLRELVADHARYGLPARPETFPKQPKLDPLPDGRGHYGNWARIIGKHHSRDHWARVYAGEWLSDQKAVDHVTSLTGDDPALVPADAEAVGRLNAYIRKLPNLGDGQGRDEVAFQLMAFASRDLQLPDDQVLRYAEHWDAGNTPPKGRARLAEILANVHSYGKHAYGSGLGANKSRPNVSANGDGKPQQQHFTDLGNGQRLIQVHGRDLRHCHPWSKWLAWAETHWRTDDCGEAERRAKGTVVELFAAAATTIETIKKQLEAPAHE